jgi:hypothetical protein
MHACNPLHTQLGVKKIRNALDLKPLPSIDFIYSVFYAAENIQQIKVLAKTLLSFSTGKVPPPLL